MISVSILTKCFQDTRFIERIYQGKFATAVMTFFPTIGLSRDKFDKKGIVIKNNNLFYSSFI